jgi:hypothetical protein
MNCEAVGTCLQAGVLKRRIFSKLNSVTLVRERTIPTERSPLVGEVSAKLLRIEGCRVVSAADLYGHNLGFLDRSHYCLFQVAPQLYSRG